MVVEHAWYRSIGIPGFNKIGWHGFNAIELQEKFLQDISVTLDLFQDRRADRTTPWRKVSKKVIQCLSLLILFWHKWVEQGSALPEFYQKAEVFKNAPGRLTGTTRNIAIG
jgi:hypothetical protein